jgi:hypothetical protein
MFVGMALFTSCEDFDMSFENHCKTTKDGFRYYYNENTKKGAYIIGIPDVEDLVIPEYIDGKKVTELGHRDTGIGYMKDYAILGNNTKKLTIQHYFYIRVEGPVKHFVSFPNLDILVFRDFLYCFNNIAENELTIPSHIGKKEESNITVVELRKSNREIDFGNFKAKTIIIPYYVEIIDSGVFAGLTDVVIKTSYETKPEGWADGWNGDNQVEWGAEV